MTEETRKVVRFEREWIVSELDLDDPREIDNDEKVIEKALKMYNEEGTIEDMYLNEDHAREVRGEDKTFTETLAINLTKEILDHISENGNLKDYDFNEGFYNATTPEKRYKIYYENDDQELDLLDLDLSVVETPYQLVVQIAKNIMRDKVERELIKAKREMYLPQL